MLSDESSSDSETGRFKCRSKNEDEHKKNTNRKEDIPKSTGRSRPGFDDKYRREFDRDRYDRHSKERYRFSRHSPLRRRHSRERSGSRHVREREKSRHTGDSRPRSRQRDRRSDSRDRRKRSRSRSQKPFDQKQNLKEMSKHNKSIDAKSSNVSRDRSSEKIGKVSVSPSPSPEYKGKKSEIHKPKPEESRRATIKSPVLINEQEETDVSVVQPGSYYNMIPTVVKEESEKSSEIDSSDDERLRAKLLKKEMHASRKKKHKSKSKRKSSKSSKERDQDLSTTIEVSSTTDIDKATMYNVQVETTEVTSTQKSNQKESSEEGEITSDDDSQKHIEIDPSDLRHKLKRSAFKVDASDEINRDKCGPALPPHLERRFRSNSREMEGPALPPHFQRKSRNIGPSIPDDMRKVLAESDCEIIEYQSSDEDLGIGPLPSGNEEKWTDAHRRLEERALEMKIKKLDGHSLQNEVKTRERWMVELPEGKAKYLGLEARSFRTKDGPDMSDRSSWTDTPVEKARKAAGVPREEDMAAELQREARARHVAIRDEEQEKSIKKHKKKHKKEESLLEMHQKKIKKKKKKEKEEDVKERRPFSRDVDLQVNRFDEAQKKSIIKKAQDLNSRFSRGEAKFL